MAAGLGFKDFTTGEVLTAADVDGYLMQGVWVFASAAARDAAVTSPQEGNFAYLKDTNTTTYYTGSAWTNLDTTGMVNPMTTTGDTIYSSSGSTPARLGIGSTGQVLTVAGGVPSWASPASGGGLTLLSTTTVSGAGTITVSNISQSYKNLFIYGKDIKHTGTPNENIYLRLNGDTGTNYQDNYFVILTSAADPAKGVDSVNRALLTGLTGDDSWNLYNRFLLNIYRYTETEYKMIMCEGRTIRSGQSERWFNNIAFNSTSAITSLSLISGTTNFGGGTLYIYGVS